MNVIIIGLGSMGKRRIRLLSEHQELKIFGIDSNPGRCQEVMEKFGIRCFSSISEAVKEEHIDAAMICTSPLSHAGIIKECLSSNLHVFTEINLVSDGYEMNMALAESKGLVLFLSSTFLYQSETLKIIERVKSANISKLNYLYHVGQYLPDWHPWESYNNYFIGNPRTNGCREILTIDLPWIVTAFGDIKYVKVLKSKNTNLNIEYNDNYLIMLEHESGAKGVFAVDVVARKAVRHFEVYGEDLHVTWEGTPETLVEYMIDSKEEIQLLIGETSEHIEGYSKLIDENPYRDEIQAFLDAVTKRKDPKWDFEKDYALLKIIDKIEE
ncbi:MAG: Gfo/Idh/MocA family oxidoreductase [Bacteroidaceae bacterium]|nr:Gfo/Idh/MocA family oxidoreductase [Bacteroidaceae bacterium]